MEKEQTGGAETRVTMNNYTKEDIIRLVEEEDVEFIRLQFTDLFGNLKNIAVTASQLDRVLSNKCMFDGSAIDGFARIEESDMYLYPDLSTLEIFPWRPQQGKVARMICDVYRPNGQPFEGDPRYVLKRAVQQAEDMGYTFEVGPECEFFLFNTDENTMPTTNTHEQAGYFDIGPLDFGENARRDIVMNLEDMGFVIEASHHEMAPAQHEIDFKYDEALNTADNIMTFKMAVRTIARRHGLHATFMPKPKFGVNGSGMHQYVLAEGWKKHFPGCFRSQWSERRGLLFHRRYHETYQRNGSHYESAGEFLQASGTRFRGTGLHCMEHDEPQPLNPYSGCCRRRGHPYRAA